MRSWIPLLALAACTGTPRHAPPKQPPPVEVAVDLPDPGVVVVPYAIGASSIDGSSLGADYPLRIPAVDDAAAEKLAALLPAFELISVRTVPHRIDVLLRPKQRDTDMLAALETITPALAPWCGSPERWSAAAARRDSLQNTFDRTGTTGSGAGFAISHVHAFGPKAAMGAPEDTYAVECWVVTGERLQRASLTQALAHPAFVVHEKLTTLEGVIDDSDGCAEWRAQGLGCDPIPSKDHFYPDPRPATTVTRDRTITPEEAASYRFSVEHGMQPTCDGRMRLTIRVRLNEPLFHSLEQREGKRVARTTHELTFDSVLLDVITGEQLADAPSC
jgi:hypothetical protein